MRTTQRVTIITTTCLLIAGIALSACGSSSSAPPLVGTLYFSQDGNANGLFELDTTTGTATLIGTGETGVTSSTIGLTESQDPDELIGSTYSDITRIAADGSAATVEADTEEAEALAMNIVNGILYGAINGAFFTIDTTTWQRAATLTAPGTDIEGLAVNPGTGIVYGLSRDDQLLYMYDPNTTAWSTIGDTGQSWTDTGLAFDHLAGVLYAIDSDTNALYRIDPATAATTLVGPLGTDADGGLAFVAR